MKKYYAGIGSRQTPDDVCELMRNLARKLEERGYILRSGGAGGADTAFEEGVLDDINKEIFLPWKKFNKNPSPLYKPTPKAFILAEQFHPAWWACSPAARFFHARNSHQVLGEDLNTPVEFILCWTKAASDGGGTGQALRIARHHNIPIFNLCDTYIREGWEKWLEDDNYNIKQIPSSNDVGVEE